MSDSWKQVADSLERTIGGPSEEQQNLANQLGIAFAQEVPQSVAAVILRQKLAGALGISSTPSNEIPSSLHDLEESLGVKPTMRLVTGTREEISAWFEVRYRQLTIEGLRSLKPQSGDIVRMASDPDTDYLVSSIGRNGRVYMKGGRGKSAWPNYLTLISREGLDQTHEQRAAKVAAELTGSLSVGTIGDRDWSALSRFKVDRALPPEAIRRLEELLETKIDGAATNQPEASYQQLLTEYPAFLAFLVTGNWATYVIPKQKLGNQYETDYLVLGENSLGPQWIAVEIESPRHKLLTKDGRLRKEVSHAVDQIKDWRDWLSENVAYARSELHLHGINNQIDGLVIIGRGSPKSGRDPARSRIREADRIQIHSWDWLLRECQKPLYKSAQVLFDSPTDLTL